MKRISKKTREEAALLLSGVACTRAAWMEWSSGSTNATAGASQEASDLADAAIDAADPDCSRWVDWKDPTVFAEAEALLRTGWSPSS